MFSIISKLGNKKFTLKELAELWLQSKKLNVKESSFCNYKRNLYDYIYPLLGDLKYSSIKKQQLNEFVEYLLTSGRKDGKGGLSKGTVKDIITVLKSVSKFAHNEYKLNNICENLKLPKVKKTKFKCYQIKSERSLKTIYLTISSCQTSVSY